MAPATPAARKKVAKKKATKKKATKKEWEPGDGLTQEGRDALGRFVAGNACSIPTKYHPCLGLAVVQIMETGASITEVAVALGVHRDTMYAWEKQYPEFAEALARGRQAEQAWWERAVRTSLYDKNFNGAVVNFHMARRFRDDYGDKPLKIEHSGTISGMLNDIRSRNQTVRVAGTAYGPTGAPELPE